MKEAKAIIATPSSRPTKKQFTDLFQACVHFYQVALEKDKEIDQLNDDLAEARDFHTTLTSSMVDLEKRLEVKFTNFIDQLIENRLPSIDITSTLSNGLHDLEKNLELKLTNHLDQAVAKRPPTDAMQTPRPKKPPTFAQVTSRRPRRSNQMTSEALVFYEILVSKESMMALMEHPTSTDCFRGFCILRF